MAANSDMAAAESNAWIGRQVRIDDSLDPWRARALSGALGLEAPLPEAGDPL